MDNSSPVLAFDLGGTRLKAGIVQGGVADPLLVEPIAGLAGDALLRLVAVVGRRLMDRHDPVAVGLAIRGIVDPVAGVLRDVNEALTALIGLPLGEILAGEFGRQACVENDARMYALGELTYGAGTGCRDLICLTLGTGIGSGVALGGRMLCGPRGVGGILAGHLTIQAGGPACTCGNIGCLEALIGAAAFVRAAHEALDIAAFGSGRPSALRREGLDPRAIFAAAGEGDDLACAMADRFAAYLGAGVVTMIHAYDPELVVLGGGMIGGAECFLPAVQAYVERHAWTLPRGRVPVVPAALGDAAALIGVATLARGVALLL